jgi:hypothetical protein
MPAVIEELFSGHTETLAEKSVAELPYVVRDAADEDEVKAIATVGTPTVYAGLPRKSIEIAERINEHTWKVTVRYESPESGSPGDEPVFSFDTGGGTQHITQSLGTVARYGANAPDFKGAIGVTADAVEGVDITLPVYAFSETHFLADSVVTNPYKGILFMLTGRVNQAGFRGFFPGECLFLGASGSRRGTYRWEINFKFASSPNRAGLTVGGIAGISKKGWEYMWVRYADSDDAASKSLIKKAVAVYVEKVYEDGDFSLLGIGT